MLLDLVRRDWLLHRRALLPILAIFGVFQVYFTLRSDSPRGWLVFTGLYAAFLTIVPFTREEKFGSVAWTCTLPVTRTQIVRARFVEAWLLVAVFVLGSALLAVLLPGSAVRPAGLVEPATILLAAVVVTLILSLLLPFTIRFGLLGVMIFLIAAQLLGAALLLVAMWRRTAGSAGGNPVRALIGGIRAGVTLLQETLTPSGFWLATLVVLAAVHWVAYRSAVALFRRKEL